MRYETLNQLSDMPPDGGRGQQNRLCTAHTTTFGHGTNGCDDLLGHIRLDSQVAALVRWLDRFRDNVLHLAVKGNQAEAIILHGELVDNKTTQTLANKFAEHIRVLGQTG